MPKTDKELKTIDYYDKNAANWLASKSGDINESHWKIEISRFLDLLPTGKIIEIGSGPGKEADIFIAHGLDYTGTDASRGFIEMALKRNPGAIFLNQAVDELDFPLETYDGFWCSATLLHIPKERIDFALQAINKVVKPGGIGFVSLKAGAGERMDPKTGRWYAFYSQTGFREILERNGFEIAEQNVRREDTTNWLIYFVRKS